jgi:hypothetical protein
MPKTFIPQYIRVLRKLAKYASTHGSTMQPNMTADQYATLAQIVAASAVFDGVAINEQP